jgi:hypothetical protein
MIYSLASLQELEDVLAQYGDKGSEHGPMRIVRTKDESGYWRDSNRTIVVLSKYIFDNLMRDGLWKPFKAHGRPAFDFRVVPYEVRENNLPGAGFKSDLFIRLPKDSNFSVKEVEEIIHQKMQPLVKFGVIGADDFKVKVPLKSRSRSTGEAFGSCFIAFESHVSDHTAALVKAAIDDTYWGDSDKVFRCFWSRLAPQKPSEDVKRVGLDKAGNKAFFKHEVIAYEEVNKGKKTGKGGKKEKI